MKVVYLTSSEQKAKGLQNMSPIPDDTIFFFDSVYPGSLFHSENVREPFDIVFLSNKGEVLENSTLVPEGATIVAPLQTMYALESKEGFLIKMGMDVGRTINLKAILDGRG